MAMGIQTRAIKKKSVRLFFNCGEICAKGTSEIWHTPNEILRRCLKVQFNLLYAD